MLKIRLTRLGRRKTYFYRIVVAEKDNPIKGKFLEVLGNYNPTSNPKKIDIDKDRIKYWISVGAIPTPSCASLFKKEGMEAMDKYFTKPEKKAKSKKEAEKKEEAPAA